MGEEDFEILYKDILDINKDYKDKPLGSFPHAFEAYMRSYNTDIAVLPLELRLKLSKNTKNILKL